MLNRKKKTARADEYLNGGKNLSGGQTDELAVMDSHQPTYPCPQCGVQFLSATDLRRHIYAIHYSRREDSPNPRLVSSVYLPRGCRECPICLRVFAGSDNVRRHVSQVDAAPLIVCPTPSR